MKKVIKLTESDLENIIQKVLSERTMEDMPGEHPLCKVKCKKKVLGKGNVGVDVKMVQSALSKCGFNKEKEGGGMNAGCGKDYKKCDGKFDVETQKAVREFQKDRGITIDGLVGPRTLEELTKGQDPCLAPFKCNCTQKTRGDKEGVVPGTGEQLTPGDKVSVGCNKSIECFQKYGMSHKNLCMLYKCLVLCAPKGVCDGKKDTPIGPPRPPKYTFDV